MAFGDVGGPVTELIATMRTQEEGPVDIKRGDALCMTGNAYYEVGHGRPGTRIIGQALVDCRHNSTAIPVRLRGVCEFVYTPTQYGTTLSPGDWVTLEASDDPGRVSFEFAPENTLVLAVDTTKQTVMVLL